MKSNAALRYTLYGILLGLIFPIVTILFLSFEHGLPLSLGGIIQAHRLSRLQLVIDTMPVFLGVFAYFAGRNQIQVERLNRELNLRLEERARLFSQLETSKQNLEKTVEQRVTQLRTISQIASEATSTHDLSTLMNHAAHLVSEGFGVYHVGIFLNDANNLYTVLQASNSEGGQRMLARAHKLKVGETGIVGYVAAKGQPRIALDVGKDAVFFSNPDLPLTRSEIALPLKSGGKVIGVLDVQTTEPAAFDENDITTLQIIADSLASAIENARLFTETEKNLQEIQTLHSQFLQRAWRERLGSQGSLEYTYQRPTSMSAPPPRKLQVPIRLRNQVIGTFSVEADPLNEAGVNSQEWTAEELNLIEAVTNQAAFALENARLLEQIQHRASQEELINQIVARTQASMNLDTVLRTAIQEIGQALNVARVQIRLGEQIEQPREHSATQAPLTRGGNGSSASGSQGNEPSAEEEL